MPDVVAALVWVSSIGGHTAGMQLQCAFAWCLLFCCRRCCRRLGDIDQRPHWAKCSSQSMSDVVAGSVTSIAIHTGRMQFAARICCSSSGGCCSVVVDVVWVRVSLIPAVLRCFEYRNKNKSRLSRVGVPMAFLLNFRVSRRYHWGYRGNNLNFPSFCPKCCR